MHPLFVKVKCLVNEERKLNVAVLECLKEIYEKKLYLDWGFSSLFAFATEGLGYSEGAAYRRVKAVQLIQLEKSAAQKLQSGELTLTTAAQVQATIQQMKATPAQRQELLNSATNKSSRDSEKALATIAQNHGFAPKEKFATIQITEEAAEILKRLRALHSHKNFSDSDLIVLIGKAVLAKTDPLQQKPSAPTSAPNESARHIPAKTRRHIFQRDQGRCSFTSARGKRCNTTHFLQIDHKKPYAFGGTSNSENLRLLCGAVEKVLVHGRI